MSSGSPRSLAVGTSGRAIATDASSAAAVGPPPRLILVPPWSATPVRPDSPELDLVQRWMLEPHVAEFWQQAWDRPSWSAEIERQVAGDHSRPWVIGFEGEPVAYVEVYRVARDVIAAHHPVEPCDLGVHVAIGDPNRTGGGLGTRVLRAVSDGLLSGDHACCRVLGDPDAAHAVARRAFAAAGFEPLAEVDLPHKRAALLARVRP